MSYSDDIKRFTDKAERRARNVFIASTVEVRRSIVEGSTLTGAPGQPVGQYTDGRVGGTLKASFIDNRLSLTSWRIQTKIEYAPGIEDAVGPRGPIRLRSTVGGFHSVKKTVAGWDRIVTFVNRSVT